MQGQQGLGPFASPTQRGQTQALLASWKPQFSLNFVRLSKPKCPACYTSRDITPCAHRTWIFTLTHETDICVTGAGTRCPGYRRQCFLTPTSCKCAFQHLVYPAVKYPECILRTRTPSCGKTVPSRGWPSTGTFSFWRSICVESDHFICFTRQSILPSIYLVSVTAPESAVNLQSTVILRLCELFSRESW